jgi:hypothetical protein
MTPRDLARRSFFKTLALSGAGFVLAPRRALSAVSGDEAPDEAAPGAGFGFFTSDERAALGSLAECVLPGSRSLGAVDFIEQLLTAFDVDPPRIYAGGPFSGRTAYANDDGTPSSNFPPNSFKDFLPLSRVQKYAWRLKLYGSSGVRGGGPNDHVLGKTKGMRDVFKDGLKEALSLSMGATDRAAMALVHPLLDSGFKDALKSLTLQSAYAAPEYGGNRGLKGWRSVHFEGDNLPLGFSHYNETTQAYAERADAPVSTLSPGPDPDKMSWFTRVVFRVISLVLRVLK